jgi:recombinational DNA repair ATPase RecF
MTAPRFTILTQKELTIDLSRPAMAVIINAIETREPLPLIDTVQCELDNFRNTLLNLLERSEPEPGNLDLIGD